MYNQKNIPQSLWLVNVGLHFRLVFIPYADYYVNAT